MVLVAVMWVLASCIGVCYLGLVGFDKIFVKFPVVLLLFVDMIMGVIEAVVLRIWLRRLIVFYELIGGCCLVLDCRWV